MSPDRAYPREAARYIRPFELHQDLGEVVELIQVAFGAHMDPTGRAVLEEMRRRARWSRFWRWLWPSVARFTAPSGFVWVEDGRVVGNVSLRRASAWAGILIGNVAVHPDWRRRGIGRSLMRRAIEYASDLGARWVGLEVRAGNDPACQLYEQLGFQPVGRTRWLVRPPDEPAPVPGDERIRRGRARDTRALVGLARETIAKPQRPLLEFTRRQYTISWDRRIDSWLAGRWERWWVAEAEGRMIGAVRAVRGRGDRPDQIEILVQSRAEGEIESALLHRAIRGLRPSRRMIQVVLPRVTPSLIEALETAGFKKARTLVQMNLPLSRSVSISAVT